MFINFAHILAFTSIQIILEVATQEDRDATTREIERVRYDMEQLGSELR